MQKTSNRSSKRRSTSTSYIYNKLNPDVQPTNARQGTECTTKKKVIMKHFRARKYAKVYLADYGKSSDHYTL